LGFSNEKAPVEKELDGDAVLIMLSDGGRLSKKPE
jgi:hypothetical protein